MGQRWEHFVTAPKVTTSTRRSGLATSPDLYWKRFLPVSSLMGCSPPSTSWFYE